MEIWLPDKAKPAFRCRVCSKPFFENERTQWMNHVAKCAQDNREQIMAANPYEQASAFMRSWDPEHDQWLAEHPGGW